MGRELIKAIESELDYLFIGGSHFGLGNGSFLTVITWM